MEENHIYRELSERTGNAVLIGVTGPMRSGKSTFVKRFMEELVLPHIDDPYRAERARDELPLSGSGKTIMTMEPKFVPEEAVEIRPDGVTQLSVRLIDSVGYMIPGVLGAEEDGEARMVTTPWFDDEIPMSQAAELGTKKVMQEHSTVGVIVTTDGSVTDIPRDDYMEAERRAIEDMQKTGKPFIVIINSADPQSKATQSICESLHKETNASVLAANCQSLTETEIREILSALLMEFPAAELRVFMPSWLISLPEEHPLKEGLYAALKQTADKIAKLSQAEPAVRCLLENEALSGCRISQIDPGTGTVSITLDFPEELFYRTLSELSGLEIRSDSDLIAFLASMSEVKNQYDKVSGALEQALATGYGIAMPRDEEIELEAPQVIKKGGSYAVKLKARAPSIHMIRTDLVSEVSPIVGTQKQTEEFGAYLLQAFEEDPKTVWETNIFGKPLRDFVQEDLAGRMQRMPDEVKPKFRKTLQRIMNEGGGGLICILL